MKNTYTLKYRTQGRFFFKKLKNVLEDGITEQFRWFRLENDILIQLPIDTEIIFYKDRQDLITHQLSKTAGQPVQRS